ncbi:enoyl-CoA hydratase-related protein [Streptomyces populi]
MAASSATFTTAFAGIGLSCDTGISWTLPCVAGRAMALDLLPRPRLLGAAEALGPGLLHQVVADEDFEGTVQRSAAEPAAGPTRAFAAMKTAVTSASGPALDAALEHEAARIALTGATDDYRTGLNAFPAKRVSLFTGR